ncbi:MAG TPA: PAS domain S-box protein [Thermoanaerobaculia bacterium]|nr:PAS domain S-box protein [Thermoanaerobaculia bacterium]
MSNAPRPPSAVLSAPGRWRGLAAVILATVTISTLAALHLLPSVDDLLSGLLDGANASLLAVCSLLAWTRLRSGPSRAALLLVAFFPILATLELLRAMRQPVLVEWLGFAAEAAAEATRAGVRFWTAVLYIALSILVMGWRERSFERMRSLVISLAVPALVALCGVMLYLLASTEASPMGRLASVMAALHLALLVTAGMLALSRVEWGRASWVTRSLILSLIPQAAGQLEQLMGLAGLGSSHFVAVHGHELLAISTVFGGLLFEVLLLQREAARAQEEASAAHTVLAERTRQLERVDLELAETQAEKESALARLRMLEKAVETMSLGVTVTDVGGRILYANPADARMHGYRPQELIGEPASRFGLPSGAEGPPSGGLQLWAREGWNRDREGRVFPVRLISDPLLGPDGHPIALVTICEDITEQKQVQRSLERRDRILEAVSDAAERLLLSSSWQQSLRDVLGRLGWATEVDRVYLRQLGEGPAGALLCTWQAHQADLDDSQILDLRPRTEALEVLGESPTSEVAVHGPVRELPALLREAFERRGIHSVALVPVVVRGRRWGILSLESEDPTRTWPSAEIEALETASRILGGAVQRQHAEELLLTSEANYRELIETANDMIQSVSPEGDLLFVNRAWRETLGYDESDLPGLSVWQVIDEAQHAHCRQVMAGIFEGGKVGSIETVFVRRDGARIPVEGSLSCRFQAGRPVATLGFFRDVTERHLIDRMKQDFISTVNHELRTPLTSMLGSLGLLQSRRMADQPEKAAELLAIATRNGERLLRLINDLLDLQKMAAGELTLKLAPTEIGPLLTEAIEGIRGWADSLGVGIDLADSYPAARFATDRDRMVQVLYNLLSNAIKFSPTGQRVRVETGLHDGRIRLSVTDHGPGIPEEFRRRLFERFAQADNANARRTGGSGLGLSIVRAFVEQLGGTIRIDSQVGVGTTVSLEFRLVGVPMA